MIVDSIWFDPNVMVNVKVNLDSQRSLDVVHRLFESVSSSVFRPVDIVLKTLFIDTSNVVSRLTATATLLCYLFVLKTSFCFG